MHQHGFTIERENLRRCIHEAVEAAGGQRVLKGALTNRVDSAYLEIAGFPASAIRLKYFGFAKVDEIKRGKKRAIAEWAPHMSWHWNMALIRWLIKWSRKGGGVRAAAGESRGPKDPQCAMQILLEEGCSRALQIATRGRGGCLDGPAMENDFRCFWSRAEYEGKKLQMRMGQDRWMSPWLCFFCRRAQARWASGMHWKVDT